MKLNHHEGAQIRSAEHIKDGLSTGKGEPEAVHGARREIVNRL
jgi:hypothetical protein